LLRYPNAYPSNDKPEMKVVLVANLEID